MSPKLTPIAAFNDDHEQYATVTSGPVVMMVSDGPDIEAERQAENLAEWTNETGCSDCKRIVSLWSNGKCPDCTQIPNTKGE